MTGRKTTMSTALQTVPVAQGMAALDFTQALALAELLSEGSFVPQQYKGKPGDVLAAMMLGHDVGLGPLAALQSIAVVNGNPTIWGDGLWALVLAHPTT